MSKVSKEFAIKYLVMIKFDCFHCRTLGFNNCDGDKQEHNYTCNCVKNKIIDLIQDKSSILNGERLNQEK